MVDPWAVLDTHGADAFRWYYLSSQQPWAGYRFSAETVGESVRQFLLTLWNTYSFWVLYANAEGLALDDVAALPPVRVTSSIAWALSRLQGLTRTVIERMDDFDCTTAGRAIAAYVDELSNWYVRLNRRRFWDGDRAAVRDPAPLPGRGLEAAGSVHAVHRRRDPRQPQPAMPTPSTSATSPSPSPSSTTRELEAGVEAAMRAIELGRAARAQAKVKMRQPLRKAVIVATEAERVEIERLSEIVAAELNVKELEFVSEEGELVSYSVKPNYRTLGPRFGKAMPQVAAAIEALDPEHAAEAIRGERRIGVNVDGHDHSLEPDDLALVMQPLDGYEVEAEAGRAVALALELDDELRREGLAREIVHAIQNARKQGGLDVTDRIQLTPRRRRRSCSRRRVRTRQYVAGETLATSVSYAGAGGVDGDDRRRRVADRGGASLSEDYWTLSVSFMSFLWIEQISL